MKNLISIIIFLGALIGSYLIVEHTIREVRAVAFEKGYETARERCWKAHGERLAKER